MAREARLSRSERIVRIALAALFGAAGLLKIADPTAFALSMARLGTVPRGILGPVAIVLPWIEVVTAAALFIPPYRRAALALLLGLLVGFTGVLVASLAGGRHSGCGCFGSADGVLGRTDVAVARNAVLLAMALFLARRKTTSPASPASPA